jgi:hypothetical protein
VKDPEHEHRPAHVLRHLAMAALEQRQDAGEHRTLADLGRGQRAALDEAHDQDAGGSEHHLGRQAGGMRGAARRQLVEAHHAMQRNVVADPHDEAPAAILDQEVGIGDAALERLRRYLAAPAGQGGGPRQEVARRGLSHRRVSSHPA